MHPEIQAVTEAVVSEVVVMVKHVHADISILSVLT